MDRKDLAKSLRETAELLCSMAPAERSIREPQPSCSTSMRGTVRCGAVQEEVRCDICLHRAAKLDTVVHHVGVVPHQELGMCPSPSSCSGHTGSSAWLPEGRAHKQRQA